MSEETELPAAKFRKTKTEKWAVMAPVVTLEAALASDGKVDVLKKSGDWGSFTVGSLGKPFDVDGIQMCYGYAPGDEDPRSAEGSGGGGSAGGAVSGARRGGGPTGGAPSSEYDAPPPSLSEASPPRDDSEPLPEYQGGPEDEWSEGF